MRRLNFNTINRKMLYYILSIIVVCIFVVSFAYAALFSVLNINGNAQVASAEWNIHFANPKVKQGSVNDNVPTITTPTTATFSTILNNPGDFYEFTIDIVNDGMIDAMIEEVIKTPELTAEQSRYIRYEVSYENGDGITTKQLITRNSLVRLKIKIEFRKDITSSDLPSSSEMLNLGLSLRYTQSDDSSIDVNNSGLVSVSASGDVNNIGEIVRIGDEKFYVIGTEGNNIKLLSMMNISLDDNPIQTLDALKTEYSNENHKGEEYSSYRGSVVEKYVNNYKLNLEEMYDIDIISARLINNYELNSMSCDIDYYDCSSAPSFMFETSYWTNVLSSSSLIFGVTSDLHVDYYDYSNNSTLGVRPVIIISQDYFPNVENNIINFTIEGVSYQAKKGMTFGEWVISNFNALINEDVISLSSNKKFIEYFSNDNETSGVMNPYVVCSGESGSYEIVDPDVPIVSNGKYSAPWGVVDIPTVSGSLTYNGSSQNPVWNNYNASKMIIGGTTSSTNVGTYSTTFTLKTGYVWSDKTTDVKIVDWSIAKAAGSLSLSATSGTISNGIGGTRTFTVTRAGDGNISVTTSNSSIAKVSVSGSTVTVTAMGTGTATITVSVAAGTNYNAPSSKQYSVTITAYLVNAGSINSSLTGGFSAYAYVPKTSSSAGIAPTVTTSSGAIKLEVLDNVAGDDAGTGGTYFTKSKIDLSGYKKMYITVTSGYIEAQKITGHAYVRFGATVTRENKYTVSAAKTIVSYETEGITSSTTISLDISSLTGQHYLLISLYGAYDKSVKFTNWRLES